MQNDQLSLTTEEMKAGWHFCTEFDGLLVGPGMKSEQECCTCKLPESCGKCGVVCDGSCPDYPED